MFVFGVITTIFLIYLTGITLAAQPGEPGYCEPGKTFKIDCNTCLCNQDGRYAGCTLKGCFHNVHNKRSIYKSGLTNPDDPEFSCTPGESFMEDCNRCTCAEDGKTVLCTLKGCYHPRPKRKTEPGPAPNTQGFTCAPGARFKHECNYCTCGNDGKTASCTYAACPHHKSRRSSANGEKCEEGVTVTQECNTCNCIRGDWVCTTKLCSSPLLKTKRSTDTQVSNEDEKNCKAGSEIKRDCNTCTCVPGVGYACTKKGCLHLEGDEKNCKPDSVIKRDCNTCTCIPGVGYACTKQQCPKLRENPIETEFKGTSCVPNDTFKIDCNTCFCNNDGSGYSCSEKLCIKT